MANNGDIEKLQQKINDLEAAIGYLQHDFENQNEMIVVDAGRIQKLENSVLQINSKLDALMANSQSPRTIEDDVPPHY